MKKIFAVIMILSLMFSLFVGCGSGSKTEISGKEVAKLMLANKLLDSSALTMDGSFDFSSTEKLSSSLGRPSVIPLANISGSSYEPDANLLRYFNDYRTVITDEAEKFAGYIDKVKSTINSTGVWIKDDSELLLEVEAGVETVYVRDEDSVSICRHYVDQNGRNTYEMFETQTKTETYMLFVEGQRYEFTIYNGYDGSTTNVIVENSRGYWNMCTLYTGGEGAKNMQNLVVTGDGAFVYYGYLNPDYEYGELTTVLNSDMTADVINICGKDGTGIDIHLGAWNGITTIETDSDNLVSSFKTGSGVTVNSQEVSEEYGVRFTSGAHTEGVVNSAHLSFVTEETSVASAINKVVGYLSSIGVTCKYDMASVISNANGALSIADRFSSHYSWKGITIDSVSAVNAAEDKVWEAGSALEAQYEKVKDAKKVTKTSKGFEFENYSFAEIDSLTSGEITVNDKTVSVNGLSVTASNLEVFDSGEDYTVNLALAKLNDETAEKYITTENSVKTGYITLADVIPLAGSEDADYTADVILDKQGGSSATYSSGGTFTLSQSATFSLPDADEYGVYTLVAYVATDDGIRVSEMIPVSLSGDVSFEKKENDHVLKMELNEHKELIVTYIADFKIVRVEAKDGGYTYAEAKKLLDDAVLTFAYPAEEATIEIWPEDGAPTVAMDGDRYEGVTLRMNCINKLDSTEQYVYLIIE